MRAADTASRINDLKVQVEDLNAKVAALETINARLIACMSRFTAMFDGHSLAITEWAVDEFTARDEEAAQTQAELAKAIRGRMPRGAKFPISIHTTVVENRDKNFWVQHHYRLDKTLMRTFHLESLLVSKGVITSSDQHELAIQSGLDRQPPPNEEDM